MTMTTTQFRSQVVHILLAGFNTEESIRIISKKLLNNYFIVDGEKKYIMLYDASKICLFS